MAMDDGIQGWDDQELSERAEEAEAIGQEDPQIYIDWTHDCMDVSEHATSDIREMWAECWDAYRFRINFPEKDDWQAKMVTGEMNAAVKQATSIVRKGLRQPNWFSIEGIGPEDKALADFYKKALEIWFNPQHARFNSGFCRGMELAFAIGQSHEFIPRWVPGRGLMFDMASPWQVERDPDALPDDPWSGDYWIHFEYLDLWKVKQLGRNPNYVRLDEVTPKESDKWSKETQERRARRKDQYHQRSDSRPSVKVIEHWGVVLDKQGELLLDNARYTIAGDVLIMNPKPNPFVNLRWPGVSFTPIPDLFAFEGHGIIESSLLLWINLCNLMSLHMDDISWRVNKVREIDRMKLEDPSDVNIHPGMLLFKKSGLVPNEKVLQEVYNSPSTNEVLATEQDWRQLKENTSYVTANVVGLPGYRGDITFGETKLKAAQGMNVFDSLGEDIESGAHNIIKAALEMLVLNWSGYSDPDVLRMMSNDPFAQMFSEMPIEQRQELLRANCDIKISGISAIIQKSELIPYLAVLAQQAQGSRFAKYFKPYKFVNYEANAFGFYDPDFMVTEEEAEAIDKVEAYLQQMQSLAQRIDSGEQVPVEDIAAALPPTEGGAPSEMTGGAQNV